MNKVIFIIVTALIVISGSSAMAQKMTDSSMVSSGKTFRIIKNDGSEFIGKITSMDLHEVVVNTKNVGLVSVPKHEIKEIKEVDSRDLSATGDYKPCETFATRYFISTNGLPIEKGESYILWNWYGPDIQFGVAKNFGIGVISTWLGAPVIASAKYSIELDANTHLAIGTLLGTGSWAWSKLGIALPFGSLTWGNRRNNITFSGGYGAVTGYGTDGGRALFAVAGMTKVGKKASLVFDSFILPGNGHDKEYAALYMPGIRLQTAANKAFQFGFVGLASSGHFTPIPMFQWFRKL